MDDSTIVKDDKHEVIVTDENAEIETREHGSGLIVLLMSIVIIAILVVIVMLATVNDRHKYDATVLSQLTSQEVKTLAEKSLYSNGSTKLGVVSNPLWFQVKGKNDLVIMYPGSSTCSTGLTFDGYDENTETVTMRIDPAFKKGTQCTLDLKQYWYKLSLGKKWGLSPKITKTRVLTEDGKYTTLKKATKVSEVS